MPAPSNTQSHQEQAIALLAEQTETSVDEIGRLCTLEYAKLAIDARLTDYLPILAFRKVQAVVRGRHATARDSRSGLTR